MMMKFSANVGAYSRQISRANAKALAALFALLLFAGPLPSLAAGVSTLSRTPVDRIVVDTSLPFDEWLDKQAAISFTKMLENISPEGTAKGAVVASPSRYEPDYWFHWIRDAALVMDVIVQDYSMMSSGASKTHLWRMMNDFIDFSRENQLTKTLTGLGEPKFHVDGRAFDGPWGRPQNDGPALRALTLARYAHILLGEGQWSYVRNKLYDAEIPARTVIKVDLEFVAHHWREKSFDLWEEVKGDHFYTRISQMAALREGAKLADALGDGAAAEFYRKQASEIAATLRDHWNGQFVQITLNRVEGVHYKNSGIDSAVILGALHADLGGKEFSVMDSRLMATAQRIEQSFAEIYAVNARGRFKDVGTAIGRYPEDAYSGQSDIHVGNPWVLTTAALAEFHYELATKLLHQSSFEVDEVNVNFIRNAVGQRLAGQAIAPGMKVLRGSAEMKALVDGLVVRGDQFMKRVRLHANADGSLAEQIDRNSGYMVSARDLTWSYAAFLTARWARP